MRGLLAGLLVYALLVPSRLWAVVPVTLNVPLGGAPAGVGQAGAAAGSLTRGPSAPIDLHFQLTPGQISTIYREASREIVQRMDAIAAVPDGRETFQNTVKALDNAYAEYTEKVWHVSFLGDVSPDKAVRDAVDRNSKKMSAMWAELDQREDIYRKVKAYADKGEKLEGEQAKLLEDTLRGYEYSGMGLPPAERAKFKELGIKISDLVREFQRNRQEWEDGLSFRPEQLKGLSKDFIGSLKKMPDGAVFVPTSDDTVYGEAMRKVRSAGVRRRLYYRKQKEAAKENIPILKKLLELRHEQANMLGFRNYAEMTLTERMAQTPRRVWRFLNRLKRMLKPAAMKENEQYLARKRKQKPGAAKIYPWDYSYYGSKMFKENTRVDPKKVEKYFPVDHVVQETLKLYEELLGIRFQKIEAETWHKDVRAFRILDAKTGARLGRVYLDLYPRPGKSDGAAAHSLVKGRELPDGSYREPVAAVHANFTKPLPGKPALLKHHEVKTLFHELGHAMHQTLTATKMWSFSGSAVTRDFVEAPSQMMENFVWRPEVLARLSKHVETGKSLADDPGLLKDLLATRNYHRASEVVGQAAMAAMDLAFYSMKHVDVLKVFRKIEAVFTGEEINTASTFPARFGHIVSGYAAGYYGYLWSKVYAQDIFSVFEAAGVISPEVGARYRRTILTHGGSMDEYELLKLFLGREPSEDAFFRMIGVGPKEDAPPAKPVTSLLPQSAAWKRVGDGPILGRAKDPGGREYGGRKYVDFMNPAVKRVVYADGSTRDFMWVRAVRDGYKTDDSPDGVSVRDYYSDTLLFELVEGQEPRFIERALSSEPDMLIEDARLSSYKVRRNGPDGRFRWDDEMYLGFTVNARHGGMEEATSRNGFVRLRLGEDGVPRPELGEDGGLDIFYLSPEPVRMPDGSYRTVDAKDSVLAANGDGELRMHARHRYQEGDPRLPEGFEPADYAEQSFPVAEPEKGADWDALMAQAREREAVRAEELSEHYPSESLDPGSDKGMGPGAPPVRVRRKGGRLYVSEGWGHPWRRAGGLSEEGMRYLEDGRTYFISFDHEIRFLRVEGRRRRVYTLSVKLWDRKLDKVLDYHADMVQPQEAYETRNPGIPDLWHVYATGRIVNENGTVDTFEGAADANVVRRRWDMPALIHEMASGRAKRPPSAGNAPRS